MLFTQLKYDLLMFSREIFYLAFSLIIPPVTYIFLGQLFEGNTYNAGLSYAEKYTPSFILLITFSVIFFAFGFEQVMHRSSGVEKRILIAPVPKKILLVSNILKSIIITSFGYFMIQILGIVIYDLPFHLFGFISSYIVFIILNAALLIMAYAVYSFFKEMKSALVFSIVIFQIVLFTGGFTLPLQMMPKFIQFIAQLNPLYHMNQLFISIWNSQLDLQLETLLSFSYILILLIISYFIILLKKKTV